MRDWNGKRYWLIGASEGLGRSLAHQMSRAGVDLIVSARSEERLQELVAELPGRASYVPIDIADRDNVRAAAEEVGEIDGIVFLAGVYWPIAATGWDADKVEAMFDINLTGAVRVLGQVVPRFVEKGAGHIVLTGSLSAYRGLPGAIGYSASKAGLFSLAESLHGDLRGTQIETQIINPGFIRTRLTDKNDFEMPAILEPEEAGRVFFEKMSSGRFATHFPWGFGMIFRISQLMPDWLYFPLFFRRGG
ncbi:Oxidoreductase, short-chain dehydrogenase/reductase family [Roseibacterium elongatum DSM 19469]|uniref:Oxidoreductase, short-chain dehydrogenase/reductase family n=1 Tax=Roseicyclus elongatus DSM 19469 TaxID=1294273 RepID=W8RQ55_9RHOB|nr:SDR family NAD(P)-dependent oxidoreductase [Roseibacterium elongatum]AHM03193.1 Oxidoreductase, short-chain dehydrogenase/reductase family [Roseibacterium elongatum DSM 19469]